MKRIITSLVLTILASTGLVMGGNIYPAHAQPMQGGKDPIEITADKTLEWHRTELQYVANGNAMVKQGSTTIKADRITADYRDSAESNIDIYRLTATGNVSIDDRGNIATGDRLVYEVDDGMAVMTGDALTMTSPEQIVTARERFEYSVPTGIIKAIGNAQVTQGADRLFADTLTAYLVPDQHGKNTLERVEGDGNVKITTPTETLTGNRGLYRAADNTAIVTGAVKITRDQNVLTGERAEIDLTTSISRLFGSSVEDGQTGGRVRAVFYPENDKPAPAQEKTQDETAFEEMIGMDATPATPQEIMPVIITAPAPQPMDKPVAQPIAKPVVTAPTVPAPSPIETQAATPPASPVNIPLRKPEKLLPVIVSPQDGSAPIDNGVVQEFRIIPLPDSISRPLPMTEQPEPATTTLDDLAR